VTDNSSIKGIRQVKRYFTWRQKQSQLPKRHASLKNYITHGFPKKKTVSVNFSHAMFSLLDFIQIWDS